MDLLRKNKIGLVVLLISIVSESHAFAGVRRESKEV